MKKKMKVKLLKKFRKIANEEYILTKGIDCYFVEKLETKLSSKSGMVFSSKEYEIIYCSPSKDECITLLNERKRNILESLVENKGKYYEDKPCKEKDVSYYRDKRMAFSLGTFPKSIDEVEPGSMK